MATKDSSISGTLKGKTLLYALALLLGIIGGGTPQFFNNEDEHLEDLLVKVHEHSQSINILETKMEYQSEDIKEINYLVKDNAKKLNQIIGSLDTHHEDR